MIVPILAFVLCSVTFIMFYMIFTKLTKPQMLKLLKVALLGVAAGALALVTMFTVVLLF